MSKTIWIINQYASTPATGIGGRHYYLARELLKQGHNVYLVAASYTHILRAAPKISSNFHLEDLDGLKFLWIKTSRYEHAHSAKRVLSWITFAWKLRSLKTKIKDKPQVIIYSSPSLIGFLGAKYLSKKLRAKLVFEVRDIWPLTLTKIGGVSKRHPLIMIMQWIEDKAYRESSVVLSNLKGAYKHMVTRGLSLEKFHWLPNGFSFDEAHNKELLSYAVKAQVPQNKFVVGYAGTIGAANALGYLASAAEKLIVYEDIVFVIVGDGKLKSELVSKKISNIIFIDPIPKTQVQSMLESFDVCYIGWNDDSLYDFGIGANKIPEYLYSGKPVLHSYSGAENPISDAKAGITVMAESSDEIVAGVLQLYNMSSCERVRMGENGRSYAKNNFEYGQISKKLIRILLE